MSELAEIFNTSHSDDSSVQEVSDNDQEVPYQLSSTMKDGLPDLSDFMDDLSEELDDNILDDSAIIDDESCKSATSEDDVLLLDDGLPVLDAYQVEGADGIRKTILDAGEYSTKNLPFLFNHPHSPQSNDALGVEYKNQSEAETGFDVTSSSFVKNELTDFLNDSTLFNESELQHYSDTTAINESATEWLKDALSVEKCVQLLRNSASFSENPEKEQTTDDADSRESKMDKMEEVCDNTDKTKETVLETKDNNKQVSINLPIQNSDADFGLNGSKGDTGTFSFQQKTQIFKDGSSDSNLTRFGVKGESSDQNDKISLVGRGFTGEGVYENSHCINNFQLEASSFDQTDLEDDMEVDIKMAMLNSSAYSNFDSAKEGTGTVFLQSNSQVDLKHASSNANFASFSVNNEFSEQSDKISLTENRIGGLFKGVVHCLNDFQVTTKNFDRTELEDDMEVDLKDVIQDSSTEANLNGANQDQAYGDATSFEQSDKINAKDEYSDESPTSFNVENVFSAQSDKTDLVENGSFTGIGIIEMTDSDSNFHATKSNVDESSSDTISVPEKMDSESVSNASTTPNEIQSTDFEKVSVSTDKELDDDDKAAITSRTSDNNETATSDRDSLSSQKDASSSSDDVSRADITDENNESKPVASENGSETSHSHDVTDSDVTDRSNDEEMTSPQGGSGQSEWEASSADLESSDLDSDSDFRRRVLAAIDALDNSSGSTRTEITDYMSRNKLLTTSKNEARLEIFWCLRDATEEGVLKQHNYFRYKRTESRDAPGKARREKVGSNPYNLRSRKKPVTGEELESSASST